MPTFAVDWDGTCVEQVYPDEGNWLPGAVEALHLLDRLGTVLIHSVRIAPVAPFTEGREIPKPGEELPIPEQSAKEVAYIRRMLDSIGLYHVEIWQRPYKPPAMVYIDDRAVHFQSWPEAVEEVMERMVPIGG